jgi:uncharacterized protein YigE (DUF2233 family)
MLPIPFFRLLTIALCLGAAGVACAAPVSREVRLDDVLFRVVDIDLATDRLELHWKGDGGQALASIDGLRLWGDGHGRSLLFAANAGIYDRLQRPLGLHVEEGRTLRELNTTQASGRSGNFAMQPNGVFYVDRDGHAEVVTTQRWRERKPNARIATQSGPMLLVDGEINPNFDDHSDSRKWRSGVCASKPGLVEFAISEVPVTFHAFARLFRDELGCRDALYLDGTLSRIYTQDAGYAGAPEFMLKPYVGMFAVFDRPPAD